MSIFYSLHLWFQLDVRLIIFLHHQEQNQAAQAVPAGYHAGALGNVQPGLCWLRPDPGIQAGAGQDDAGGGCSQSRGRVRSSHRFHCRWGTHHPPANRPDHQSPSETKVFRLLLYQRPADGADLKKGPAFQIPLLGNSPRRHGSQARRVGGPQGCFPEGGTGY